ncbi:MAG: divalent metal cation transporter, partial [Alphaproteobacteria bacterium]|nr:divalent metal cation transporter [Alphaproteobacteria bacterium]
MTEHPQHTKKQSLLEQLGPGLISGAADDDPSGIATYSQAGAQFGFSMLWTAVLTYPFMAAIQLISAKIGRVTGIGIVANVKNFYPKPFVLALVTLLVLANTINIAADVAAMGSALELVLGGPAHGHLYGLLFGLFCIVLQVFIPYRRYSPILKTMTMILFVYVVAAFTVHIPWREVMVNTIFPQIKLSRDYILTIVAVFGTTISPYLFFWQASQEIEEMNLSHHHVKALKDLKTGGYEHIKRIRFDTMVGMAFSNI